MDNPYSIARKAQAKAIRQRHQRQRRSKSPPTPKWHLELGKGSASQVQGSQAEAVACDYLIAQGLEIIASNLRCRLGEIDLLAIDGETMVFIEVRKRNNICFGGAAASINRQKQQRIIRSASFFLRLLDSCAKQPRSCRFDVVTIENNNINWIRHAFIV